MRSAILDDQDAPLRSASRDRQCIVPGALQLQRQIGGRERVTDHPGLRRSRGNGDLARGRDAGPGKWRCGKDEGVLGTERVSSRPAETKQKQTRQPDAADNLGEEFWR